MDDSDYLIQASNSTRCPTCSEHVDLLIRRGGGGPIFFLCFRDQIVYQVGVGVVDDKRKGGERESQPPRK